MEAFGLYLRAQRQVADLSLRELARLTKLSNAYISQLERGLHQPSVRVVKSLADALAIPVETLLTQVGLTADNAHTTAAPPSTEAAIRADPLLSDAQKRALLGVYASYIADAAAPAPGAAGDSTSDDRPNATR